MWELDHKESWAPKNWCFWTVMLKTLESPLDCKEIKPVNPEGNQSWIFIGRTDARAEATILWPPDAKKWFIGKDPDVGKDWRQEEKGMTKDEMVWRHHQLYGCEFEPALGVGDGQGILVSCSPWGRKESDMTERLNWIESEQESRLSTGQEEQSSAESKVPTHCRCAPGFMWSVDMWCAMQCAIMQLISLNPLGLLITSIPLFIP